MNTEINGFFPRVSQSFARKIDTGLIAFVRNVIARVTGNAKYPTPSPSLATITTSVNAFEVAVQEALDTVASGDVTTAVQPSGSASPV